MFRRIVAVAGGSVVATLLPKSLTHADTFGTGPPEAGLLADGGFHHFCQGTIGAAEWDDAQAAMQYLDDATDLADSAQACVESTDVRFDNGNGVAAGTRGDWACLVAGDVAGECDGGRIRISIANITAGSPAGTVPNNLTKTVRHETGHSVGLRHYKTAGTPCCPVEHDAMISGAIDNGAAWTVYSQHHKDHINDEY